MDISLQIECVEDEEFKSAKAILTRHYITNIYFLLKLFFMQTKIYSKVMNTNLESAI